MTINHYNLYGRAVDGWYWLLLEERFEDCARRYRASGNELAASIADRLAESADDVPAQLMQEFQGRPQQTPRHTAFNPRSRL